MKKQIGVLFLILVGLCLLPSCSKEQPKTGGTNDSWFSGEVPSPFAATESKEMNKTWPSSDGLTLQEAYDRVADGGTLTILRGMHEVSETLVIRKNITILGEGGNREYVVLKGGKENVLRVESGFAEIKNLTFQNVGNAGQSDGSAVLVNSPMCAFENCLFTSKTGIGFTVNQKDSNPIVTGCAAKDCGGTGFCVWNGAKGKFTDCDSIGNAFPGIWVEGSGTNPTVEKCRFTEGKSDGILVKDGASGTFTDCESSGNAGPGIAVQGNGTNPTVEKCRVLNNGGWGIGYISAKGTFRNNTISGNEYGAWLIVGGSPVREGNSPNR